MRKSLSAPLDYTARNAAKLLRLLVILLGLSVSTAWAQSAKPNRNICDRCVRSEMDFLAADELHGRASGTRDEHLAALFVASRFAEIGLEPGGDRGSYLKKAPLPNPLPADVRKILRGFSRESRLETWNVVGILRGTDPGLRRQAILLTAHLDHLGIGPAKNGDSIYNGADDDASGTTAVIELARSLAAGGKRRRTILFVLFGAEEIGGFGNRYFLSHPPLPLKQIVATLEFEMIGHPDPAIGKRQMWMTGFSRSDLGPELARHGADLVADPHPAENFFERSDNYDLACKGIVAHAISSFGLHADYHQPGDDVSQIDFVHLDRVIASMAGPIAWLAGTHWKPRWNPGGRP